MNIPPLPLSTLFPYTTLFRSDLRHRLLDHRQGRPDDHRADPGAQSARAQERSVGSGAALRVEGPRTLARGAVSRASRYAARSESSLRRGAATCRTGQRTAAATTPQGLPPTAIRV